MFAQQSYYYIVSCYLRLFRAVSFAVAFVLPGELIKRRLIGAGAVAIFWQVKFLMLIIFDTHAMLIAPAIPLSIEASRFHTHNDTTPVL